MSHKLILSAILILILTGIGITGLCYFSHATRSDGSFYAVKPDRTTFELIPLDRPNVSTRALLRWATLAATATFTLNFVNYEKDLAGLKIYFTASGYDNFLAALNESGTLKTLVEKQMVITSVPVGPAIVSGENDVGGYHTWNVQVPITVSYETASEVGKSNKVVSLLVSQVPTREAPTGIGIAQYTVQSLEINF